MSFKYINPGYLNLLRFQQNNTNNLSYNIIPSVTKSRTGVAFVQRYMSSYALPFKMKSDFPNGEFWAKCDFYNDYSNSSGVDIYFGHYYHYVKIYDRVSLSAYLYNREIYSISSSSQNTHKDTGIRLDALNTIWLHVKEGSANIGYIEFQINNNYVGKFFITSDYSYGDYYDWFIISANDTPTYNYQNYNYCEYFPFSSIIISDEYISPNERIISLPVGNTITDFDSLPSGLYTADTASETLLQSVNVNSLIQQYGSDTNVTGIALIGNPAYQVDDVVGNLTALTKQNNVVTDHDKLTLSTDTDAMIVSSFAIDTSTTIADLANMQFGWRAEE